MMEKRRRNFHVDVTLPPGDGETNAAMAEEIAQLVRDAFDGVDAWVKSETVYVCPLCGEVQQMLYDRPVCCQAAKDAWAIEREEARG